MGRKGVVLQRAQNSNSIEPPVEGPSTSQFHVLAVDDSIVDRKVIERLLKISAYKDNEPGLAIPLRAILVPLWFAFKSRLALLWIPIRDSYPGLVSLFLGISPSLDEYFKLELPFDMKFKPNAISDLVTTVDSGRRALEFLGLDEEPNSVNIDNLKVNMIITDYCMPGMTGYDLLKRVKESSTLKEIPVVIMSSENVLARIDRCLEEGAEEFILKPVKLSDVKRLKGHIVKGQSKEQQQPTSAKRKALAENLENLQSQPSERRQRLGELKVS
eukprot:Gb_10442 [translate_table: standard]